jgi:putative NADPH-quinone reductase
MSERKNIVLVLGHPDGSKAHLCHALADQYRAGAEAAGHHVTTVDLGTLDFPLLRDRTEWEKQPAPAALLPAQKAILDANHLVIIYPLWLGGMPALLKGFLEQVLRPSLMPKGNDLSEWSKLLKGCSARIVVTMGMPGIAYRLYFRAHTLKALKRNILAFSGVGPIRSTIFGMVEGASERRRASWLSLMHKLGREAR